MTKASKLIGGKSYHVFGMGINGSQNSSYLSVLSFLCSFPAFSILMTLVTDRKKIREGCLLYVKL